MSKEEKTKAASAQRARFIEVARQLGADEDEATFKEKLVTIARAKPKDGESEPEEEP
jgi:hypothetical protein